MENSAACWQWILSARHDLTLPFMQEMISAWQVCFSVSYQYSNRHDLYKTVEMLKNRKI